MPKAERFPHCPICGDECETLYEDAAGVIFGCEHCVNELDAWEEMLKYEEEARQRR